MGRGHHLSERPSALPGAQIRVTGPGSLWQPPGAPSKRKCGGGKRARAAYVMQMQRNAMWRMPWFTHDYLVHLKSDEWDRFDKHTVETFREVADEIKRVATTGSREELETLQKHTGSNGTPMGLCGTTRCKASW